MTERVRLLTALDETTKRYRQTETAHEAARQDSIAAVIGALREGIEPTVVAERSPFTATYVRKLARDNDIPPAKPGIKPRVVDE